MTPESGNIEAADFRYRPAETTSEEGDDFLQKVFLVKVQRTEIFLMVPLNNYDAMRSSQGAGRGLHSYENTHFAAGQRIVRAVWTLPLGRPVGAAQTRHARVLPKLHNKGPYDCSNISRRRIDALRKTKP